MSKVRWSYVFIDGEAGTERLHTYLVAELTSKPSSEAWELELLFSTLDCLSIHFSRICILQNLEYILLFSLIGVLIIVLMPSWHLLDQNYDVSDIEYTCLETNPLGIELFLKTENHSAVFYLTITEIIMSSQDLRILSYLLLLLFLTLQVKLCFSFAFFSFNAIFRFGYEKNIKANSTFLLFSPTYP